MFYKFCSNIRYHLILFFHIHCLIKSLYSSEIIKKDNVLILIIDDLRHLADKNINLPNIKLLAANGITFENAFAQQALCAPSRNSMLTGRRPDALHLYDFYNYWRDTIGNFTTIPQLFKENGYSTYSIGKVFHPGISSNFTDDYPYSWSRTPYHPSTEKYKNAPVCKDTVTMKKQRNLICPVAVDSQPKHTLPDYQSLHRAINTLKKAKNIKKPFMLAIGFHKPHIPLKYPKKYVEKYPINKIKPPNMPYIPKDMPSVAWHPWTDVRKRDDIRALNLSFPYSIMPMKWSKKIIQSYYAATTYIDDMIGELLQYVDKKNTIIVLTSDHGWSLGENGLWAKYSNFDVALKVPLIFHIPNTKPRVINTPVELIDLFPTLVDITNIRSDIPKCTGQLTDLCFEGKSLMPIILNNKINQDMYSIENVALSQYPRPDIEPKWNSDKPKLKDIKIMGYSLRTQRFRYTEWIQFNNTSFFRNWNKVYGVELYDHAHDPFECYNLYKIPILTDLIKYFSKLLRKKTNQNNTFL